MTKYITILFLCLLASTTRAQTANAGSDVTIHLQNTSTATLDGSGSYATSYLWTEISQ